MVRMRVQSTSDVSVAVLREAARLLPADWPAEVDDEQMFFKSMEVPSWVSIVAGAPWWVQALAAAVSVYLTGILSEAGKDSWKHRGRIAAGVRRVPPALKQFVEFVLAAQSAGSTKTFVVLAIPFPDEFNNAHLRLSYLNKEELEFSIALFVHHIPALERLWQEEGLFEATPVGGIQLALGEDCSLFVSWMDKVTLDQCDRVLPFRDEL